MDANDITMILDNYEPGYIGAQEAARGALDSERFDWADRTENHEPAYYYGVIGNAVHDFINESKDTVTDELISLLFGQALQGVDWRAVGEHYFTDVTEVR